MTAAYPRPRERLDCVWCARWPWCGGVFVPGYRGGERAELCDECDREAADGSHPRPDADPSHPVESQA